MSFSRKGHRTQTHPTHLDFLELCCMNKQNQFLFLIDMRDEEHSIIFSWVGDCSDVIVLERNRIIRCLNRSYLKEKAA